MGYLSSLLQKYAAGDDDATKSQAQALAQAQAQAPPQPQPQPQPTTPLVGETPRRPSSPLVSDDLAEKMRSNPRARAVRQLSLFAAGATFFALSTAVTRRAITRKLLATAPRTFTPSNFQPKNVNGAVEAAEAFALATLNVGSAAMMLTGGAMYAFDITDAEDMRAKFKARMGFDSKAGMLSEEEADKEIEEWVQSMLEKKDSGESKGIAESLTALVGVLAGREEDREKLRELHGGAAREDDGQASREGQQED